MIKNIASLQRSYNNVSLSEKNFTEIKSILERRGSLLDDDVEKLKSLLNLNNIPIANYKKKLQQLFIMLDYMLSSNPD